MREKRKMKLRRGGVKNRDGNGGDRGVIGLKRDSGDMEEFANMNAVSSGLIFRPKGSEFRSGHGVGTGRELKEKWVKWATITTRFTEGWYKRRRR